MTKNAEGSKRKRAPPPRLQGQKQHTPDAAAEIEAMVATLSARWRNPVKYSCTSCLREAYSSVVSGRNGYVTDDDLIESSRHTLRHK